MNNLERTDIKKKSGRKKDYIRRYFALNDDNYNCNIDNCNKKFSFKTSITVLKYHILKDHGQVQIKNTQNNNIMENNTVEKEETEVYKLLSIAFAKNSLPHSLLDNNYYKIAIEILRKYPKIEVNKKKLKKTIISEGNKINESILDKLGNNKQPITLSIDGWTNKRSNKVINLLLISNGDVYYFGNIENDHE